MDSKKGLKALEDTVTLLDQAADCLMSANVDTYLQRVMTVSDAIRIYDIASTLEYVKRRLDNELALLRVELREEASNRKEGTE